MSNPTVGPFTPTTATLLLPTVQNTLTGPIDITALASDGWPSTFFITNTGANPTYFIIATLSWLASVDPNVGFLLLSGQSMIYEVDAPGLSQINGEALVAFTYGLGGASSLSVTGGLNQ